LEEFNTGVINIGEPSDLILGYDFVICTILSGGVVGICVLFEEFVLNTCLVWLFDTYNYGIFV
jgi:repressor of nif and glnA expression